MKTPLFIGSSSESLGFAKLLEEKLKVYYDVTLWSNGFTTGDVVYDKLANLAISSKYAIFIGGADDFVVRPSKVIKGQLGFKPRDNIYYELGLFEGLLSRHRVFFVVNKEANLASDFQGVTVIFYSGRKPAELKEAAENVAKQINEKIRQEETVYRYTFLPALSLAIGYFNNHLKPLCKLMHTQRKVEFRGHIINIDGRKIKFAVVVPKTNESDWVDWAELYYNRFAENKVVIGTGAEFPRRFDANCNDEAIYDVKADFLICNVPLTMNNAFLAVDEFLGETTAGVSEEAKKAKQLEKEAFVGALKTFINKDPLVREMAYIEEVSL